MILDGVFVHYDMASMLIPYIIDYTSTKRQISFRVLGFFET